MLPTEFAIDNVPFKDRQKKNETSPKFILKNYEYYTPKLENTFYLKYFLKEILFDIDILEVDDFLNVQFEYSKAPDNLIKIIGLKVLPAIDKITNNALIHSNAKGYRNEIKLDNGFVETEGVIKNDKYEYNMFYHLMAVGNLKDDLKQRKQLISKWYQDHNNYTTSFTPLKVATKPVHVAYIISQLIEEGYLEGPLKKDNETNYTELSKIILKMFSFSEPVSIDTLRRYMSVHDDKNADLKKSFDKSEFYLPHSSRVG